MPLLLFASKREHNMNARLFWSATQSKYISFYVHALHNVKSKEITTSDDFETIFFFFIIREL